MIDTIMVSIAIPATVTLRFYSPMPGKIDIIRFIYISAFSATQRDADGGELTADSMSN